MFAAFGCHPKKVHHSTPRAEHALRRYLSQPRTRALGEIALDFDIPTITSYQVMQQRVVFIRLLEMAIEYRKPVVIHCREAYEQLLPILMEMLPRHWKLYFHCFTGGWKVAKERLSLFPNSFLGITALVSYRNAVRCVEVREIAARVPLSRLVLETDSPYFVPQKLVHRISKKKSLHGNSSPSMVLEVAEEIASIRGIPMQEILVATCRNTRDLLYSLTC